MENLLNENNENSEILDALSENLERLNFIRWYADATPEDLEIARRNNAERLDEMIEKYKYDIELMCLIYGR